MMKNFARPRHAFPLFWGILALFFVAGGAAYSADRPSTEGAPADTVSTEYAVPTEYVVFIDDSFAIPSERNRILRGLVAELPRLGKQDKVTIFAFEGERLDRLLMWTSSQENLVNALQEAQGRPAYGLMRLSEQRRLQVSEPGFRSRGSFGSSGSFSRRGFSGSLRGSDGVRFQPGPDMNEKILQVVSAVEEALDIAYPPSTEDLSRAPASRVVLLLSGGWPLPSGVSRSPSRSFADLDDRTTLLEPLRTAADRLSLILYPVALRNTARSAEEREGSAALDRLARDTGGRLINRGNSREILKFIQNLQSQQPVFSQVPPQNVPSQNVSSQGENP